MDEPLSEMQGLQRLSLWNGIFYVHHSPVREPEARVQAVASEGEEGSEDSEDSEGPETAVASVASAVEPVLELVSADQVEDESQPEPEPAPVPEPAPALAVWRPEAVWPATSAPPKGYAYEFGTGRLVPLAFAPSGRGWQRY